MRRIRLASHILSVLLAVPISVFTQTRPQTTLQLYVYTAGEAAYNVTSTLIYGANEALLVDTQFHPTDAQQLADHIAARKVQLKAIFITHPDADHFGGMALLRKAFPSTPIYMTRTALDEFRRTAAHLEALPMPEVLPGSKMLVDGRSVEFITDLQGDYPAKPANSMVWVPSVRALIADDVVFSGIHPWLTDSTPETRAAWIKSLDRVSSLHPRLLVSGHDPSRSLDHGSQDVAFMKKYLKAFDQVRNSAPTAEAFVAELKKRFPRLRQEKFLDYAAKSSYRSGGPK
jgi:glyoxylase-like metal-dependent hydrolase (beta-lactamase superfamily II)